MTQLYFIIGFALGIAFSVDYYFHNQDDKHMLSKISFIMVLLTFGWIVFMILAIKNKLYQLLHK